MFLNTQTESNLGLAPLYEHARTRPPSTTCPLFPQNIPSYDDTYVRRRIAELVVIVGEAENGNSLEAARNVTSWNRNFRHQPALLYSEYPPTHCDSDRKKSPPPPHSPFFLARICFLPVFFCLQQQAYQVYYTTRIPEGFFS